MSEDKRYRLELDEEQFGMLLEDLLFAESRVVDGRMLERSALNERLLGLRPVAEQPELPKPRRKIVQISDFQLYALCDDGTVWFNDCENGWVTCDDIPQDGEP